MFSGKLMRLEVVGSRLDALDASAVGIPRLLSAEQYDQRCTWGRPDPRGARGRKENVLPRNSNSQGMLRCTLQRQWTPREDTVYCGKLFSRRTVVCPLCVWLHVGWHLHPGRGVALGVSL